MSVGILLLTHETMGAALIATARHILGRISLPLDTLAIPPGTDIDLALRDTAAQTRLHIVCEAKGAVRSDRSVFELYQDQDPMPLPGRRAAPASQTRN